MHRALPEINADIREAWTLPSWAYTDPSIYRASIERIFALSWQYAADTETVKAPGQVFPVTLLEGCLDEPVLLTRDYADQVHCLSNVCTHRGNVLVGHGGRERTLVCEYHGRRFDLDGKFRSMPEFEGVRGFPCEKDDLAPIPHAVWKQFLFASCQPRGDFSSWVDAMERRVGWLPVESFQFRPERSREYMVRANWALYVENYLEGFHIPYVHADLAAGLDYGAYQTELFESGVLQIGVARGAEAVFALPEGHQDEGQNVAAYYFWLFPNLMMNFYPWGLSINIVRPLGVDLTRISFLCYVWDESQLGQGAGASVDRVEREDEAIVEAVQKGVRSRFYERGRYSPKWETGTHHFHRLLAKWLETDDSGDPRVQD